MVGRGAVILAEGGGRRKGGDQDARVPRSPLRMASTDKSLCPLSDKFQRPGMVNERSERVTLKKK